MLTIIDFIFLSVLRLNTSNNAKVLPPLRILNNSACLA
jgi:hypothetical protein